MILEPEKKEEIVTKAKAIEWLKEWLTKVDFPRINQNVDFEKEEIIEDFLENTCELEIKPGYTVKWFAVRIDPD